jgi:hypothetical protein
MKGTTIMPRHPIRALHYPRHAFDGALNEAAAAELYTFLQGKLSEADLAEFCKRAGIDAGMSMDGPEPFRGMPEPGGGKFGMDARRRRLTADQEADLASRYPHAAKIAVSK